MILKTLNSSKSINFAAESIIDESPKPQVQLTDFNSIQEINNAYDLIKEVDPIDLSKEGSNAWHSIVKCYEENIDRVESRIALRLRDQLGLAKNSNEMFRIFSQYNSLFVRPQIRGAIREYQTQLIQKVKVDIETLHVKFKVKPLSLVFEKY